MDRRKLPTASRPFRGGDGCYYVDKTHRSLLRHLARGGRQEANADRLIDLLGMRDFDGLKELFHAFCAGIPHE